MTEQTTQPDVVWTRMLDIRVVRGDDIVGDRREDWVRVSRSNNGGILLHFVEDENRVELPPPAIEAIYDLYLDVPR